MSAHRSRVQYRSVDEVAPEDRDLLARPVHLYRALVNSPAACRNFQDLADWVRWQCELDPRLREMLILLVGYALESRYEWSHHIILSRQFGVSDDDIRGIIDFANGRETEFSPRELAVLHAAAEVTHELTVSDATWDLLEQHFDEAERIDLVVIASFYNMVVRVLGALRIDVEPEWAEPLTTFPLPAQPL